jgi:endonuclease/exonuclease/phosphatase family metal-dependent hydrolase
MEVRHSTASPGRGRPAAAGSVVTCLALAVLGTACAALPPPQLSARTQGRDVLMAVITWNVNAGRGDLAGLVRDLTNGALTGAPVRDFVVLLQENVQGGANDVAAVARERRLFTIFSPVRTSDRGVSGNAVLSTRPFLDARTIDLPRERRVRKAVLVTVDLAGTRLFVVSAHLENRTGWLRGGLLSDAARGRQADALLRELPPGPGILGGDLNTWLGVDEPAWRALAKRFDDTPGGAAAEPTFRERLVLDHLFFDLPPRWEAMRQVVSARYGSDHHPVLGVILQKGSVKRTAQGDS